MEIEQEGALAWGDVRPGDAAPAQADWEGRAAACEAGAAQAEQVDGADGERDAAESGVDSGCEQDDAIFYFSALVLREHAGDVSDRAVELVGNWIAHAGAVVVLSHYAGAQRSRGATEILLEGLREARASRAQPRSQHHHRQYQRRRALQRLRTVRMHHVTDERSNLCLYFSARCFFCPTSPRSE